MTQCYLGEIRPWGGNFAPRGWHYCDGSLMSIAQYDALFALLGTTYGGDGQTTFALPDLQGRVAIHQGTGPGLSTYALGQQGGTEQVTLTTQTMPAHNHAVVVSAADATSAAPAGMVPAAPDPTGAGLFYLPPGVSGANPAPFPTDTIQMAGGNQPHDNIMPGLAISYIIALEGIFPSQN